MFTSSAFSLRAVALAAAVLLPAAIHGEIEAAGVVPLTITTTSAVYHDTLASLGGLGPVAAGATNLDDEDKSRKLPMLDSHHPSDNSVLQSTAVSVLASTTAGLGRDGVGNGFTGPQGTYTVDSAPPDTNGAVGSTQYVQWVNEAFAVFDKTTGNVVYGPVAGNTLWAGFGGACETSNDGDPIVQYDKAANRWVMMQFAVPGGSAGYHQCVAVSQTDDATGAWYRYDFAYTNFNDYPKAGVWSDGYYVTFNMFSSSGSWVGPRACVFDRTSMLAGQPATQQCAQLSSTYGSLLPSDVDGTTAPPNGSPNYLLSKGTSALLMWKMHVDWATPASSTISATPTSIPIAAYTAACKGGTCVPQPGTTQKLDSLADRLMYRLAYRNFGDHEALVVNHSVRKTSSNAVSGIRWYEIRSPGTTPVLYQQATYSPDTTYRWMGSIAMDKQGNIAVGYSVSSSQVRPGIRYATRLATDTANTLGNETTVIAGIGSQNGRLDRWGDYSALSVDPTDDCTFWYTNQYLKTTGSFNWSTRINSFKINGCN